MTNLEIMEDLSLQISKLERKFEKQAGKLLSGALKEEVFDKFSNVEAVQIRGYAPYFNDGDACTFSVGQPLVKFDISDSFVDEEVWGFDGEEDEDGNEITEESIANFAEVFEAVNNVFSNLSDHVFERVFGSDQQVTFNSDGTFENDHYGSHD